MFSAHHSVFPTVTRVNASSLVTGAYPERHGLMGNTIYIPPPMRTRGSTPAKRANLEAVERAERPAVDGADAERDSAPVGKSLLAVEQRNDRFRISAESHARHRRHHPLRFHVAAGARHACSAALGPAAAARHAERCPESVRDRCVPESRARRSPPGCDVHVARTIRTAPRTPKASAPS